MAMEKYAYWLGCSFQIRDDILDYHSSSETGKDSDSDIMERKITMPLLCAMRNAPQEENAYGAGWRTLLRSIQKAAGTWMSQKR